MFWPLTQEFRLATQQAQRHGPVDHPHGRNDGQLMEEAGAPVRGVRSQP